MYTILMNTKIRRIYYVYLSIYLGFFFTSHYLFEFLHSYLSSRHITGMLFIETFYTAVSLLAHHNSIGLTQWEYTQIKQEWAGQ